MTKDEKREYNRNYMRKYNKTKKGAEYNRKHVHIWRKKTKRPHSSRYVCGEWKESIIYYLVDRDGINCFYCGKPVDLETASIAHKIAVCLGGSHRLGNFVLSHRRCNYLDGVVVRKKFRGY